MLPCTAREKRKCEDNKWEISSKKNTAVVKGLGFHRFVFVSPVVRRDLTERGLWTPEVRNQIIADQGSVQNVRQIPQELKNLYKTVWEIKQKFILNQVRCDRCMHAWNLGRR